MKKYVVSIAIALMGIIIIACTYSKVEKGKMVVCDELYALCTSAQCIPNPNNPNESICYCEVHEGKSLGQTPCKKRTPHTDTLGTKHITSTFSFEDFPIKSVMTCPSGSPWSNCLDMPCVIDPLDSSKAICSCQVIHTGTFQTLGGNCDTSTCSTGYWSAATVESNQEAIETLRKALNLEKSPERLCPQ